MFLFLLLRRRCTLDLMLARSRRRRGRTNWLQLRRYMAPLELMRLVMRRPMSWFRRGREASVSVVLFPWLELRCTRDCVFHVSFVFRDLSAFRFLIWFPWFYFCFDCQFGGSFNGGSANLVQMEGYFCLLSNIFLQGTMMLKFFPYDHYSFVKKHALWINDDTSGTFT